jgi:phosphonopyruvate decarboxylase
MLNPVEALRVVEADRDNAVVVTTMMGSRMWRRVSRNPDLDLHVGGAMGKASSVGLGLALAQPNLKVVIVDGDGSLLMNLGSLVTIANKAPANLYHLVLENGMYAMTGGQPLPGVGRFNIAGIAREAGYRATYSFGDIDEFTRQANKVLHEPGPVLLCLEIEPEIDNRPIRLRPVAARRTVDIMRDLRARLANGSGPH